MSHPVSPTGPCHGLGGRSHRCDGPPVLRSVSFNGRPADVYRWCDAAVAEARALCEAEAWTVEITPAPVST